MNQLDICVLLDKMESNVRYIKKNYKVFYIKDNNHK